MVVGGGGEGEGAVEEDDAVKGAVTDAKDNGVVEEEEGDGGGQEVGDASGGEEKNEDGVCGGMVANVGIVGEAFAVFLREEDGHLIQSCSNLLAFCGRVVLCVVLGGC